MVVEEVVVTARDEELLDFIRGHFQNRVHVGKEFRNEKLHVKLFALDAMHEMEVFYEGEHLVLVIGQWTHCHPKSLRELQLFIDKVLQEKVIIWKVSRPNGFTYYGHYDIDEYETHTCIVDQPDTVVEAGDRVQKSTFTSLVEDRVVAS